MSADSHHDRLVRLIGTVVSERGFHFEEVSLTPAGRRRLLRVVVDADGGVTVDELTELSHAVSAALDASDAMGADPYVLEVTSPGVDRPLSDPAHWRRAVGRLVRVPRSAGGEVEGRVVSADTSGVELLAGGAHRRFAYAELGHGRVQVEFRRDDGDSG